jgi:hypothetical protein
MSSTINGDSAAALSELLARQAIYHCVVSFGRGMDRLDPDLILAAFHPDADINYPMFAGTPQEMVDWAIPAHRAGYRGTSHTVTNHFVDFRGDSAYAETLVASYMQPLDVEQPVGVYGGRYIDRFELRDGRWAISKRQMVITYTGVLPPQVHDDFWQILFSNAEGVSRDRSDLSYRRDV